MSTPSNSQNAFLIRIKGGSGFRGTKPYIITCLDNDLSTELHRTRAVEGGRYVAWNEAFVIDISDYVKHKQPKHLTLVFIDANKTGVSSLGYVQLELESVRGSELEEVREDLKDGTGTITFSTTPVEQPASAFSEYAAKVKGYFASAFDGKSSSSEGSDGGPSSKPETVYGRTLGAAREAAASVVGAAHAKLSPSQADVQGKSKTETGDKEGAASAAPSRLEGLQEMLHSKVEQAKEGITHAVDKVKAGDKAEAPARDAAADATTGAAAAGASAGAAGAAGATAGAGDAGAEAARSRMPSRMEGLQEMVHTRVGKAKEGMSHALEKVKGGDKAAVAAADAGGATGDATGTGSTTASRLEGLQDMVHTRVEQAKESISQAVHKVKAGDKTAAATGEAGDKTAAAMGEAGDKTAAATGEAGDKTAAATGEAGGGAGGLQEMVRTRVEQAKEGISHGVEKLKAGDKAGDKAGGAAAEGGGAAGATASRLGGLQERLHTRAEQARQGMCQAVEKVRRADKAEGKQWPAEHDGTGDVPHASAAATRMEAMGGVLNSTVQQTRDGVASVMQRMKAGEQGGADAKGATGGGGGGEGGATKK